MSFTDDVVMSSPNSGRYLLPSANTRISFSLSTLEGAAGR
jgi:hypothetical protein